MTGLPIRTRGLERRRVAWRVALLSTALGASLLTSGRLARRDLSRCRRLCDRRRDRQPAQARCGPPASGTRGTESVQAHDLDGGEWHSFPSAHAVHVFGLAAAIDEEAGRAKVSALVYGAASVVAWSRVYHDAHWASDVVAGRHRRDRVGQGSGPVPPRRCGCQLGTRCASPIRPSRWAHSSSFACVGESLTLSPRAMSAPLQRPAVRLARTNAASHP